MPVTIQQVRGRAEQGMTSPFLCLGDDGYWYYVKGCGAGLRSLICEWVVGRMARAFGLPVPPFEQLDVPEALIVTDVRPDLAELGPGLVFGSRRVDFVQELSVSHLTKIASPLRQDVLVFDWWVHNLDRHLTSLGGNPNLLWDQANGALVVIDHNQAFDPGFNSEVFFDQLRHVFLPASGGLCDDLIGRALYAERFSVGLAVFDQACAEIPDSWWWVDHDVPVNFDRQQARDLLMRYVREDFWSRT